VKNLRALVPLCFGLMLAGTLAAGEAGPDLLTPAERAWLAAHPWKSGFFRKENPDSAWLAPSPERLEGGRVIMEIVT